MIQHKSKTKGSGESASSVDDLLADLTPSHIDWSAVLEAVKLRSKWTCAAIQEMTHGTQYSHQVQFTEFDEDTIMEITCADSAIRKIDDRIHFWSAMWTSLQSSCTVGFSAVDAGKEALSVAKKVIEVSSMVLPKVLAVDASIVDASQVISKQIESTQQSAHTALPHCHLLTGVRLLVDSPKPHLLVTSMNVGLRIFKAKTQLYMDNLSRYSTELDCTCIQMDDHTGGLVATGESIPSELCLPFFGDVIVGECKDTPRLALGKMCGVQLSLVPPSGDCANLMCPAWNIALTNEEADANCQLECYQVNVRFQETKQPNPVARAKPTPKKHTGSVASAKRQSANAKRLQDAADAPAQKKFRLAKKTPSDPPDATAVVACDDAAGTDGDIGGADASAVLVEQESEPTPPQDEFIEVVAAFDAFRIVAIPGKHAGPLCRLADAATPKVFGKLVTKNCATFKKVAVANDMLKEDDGAARERGSDGPKAKSSKPEVYIKHIHG